MTSAQRVVARYLRAKGPDWRDLFEALVGRSGRVIANAMKEWGTNKLAQWDKAEFYRKGGGEAIVTHAIKHGLSDEVAKWLDKHFTFHPWLYAIKPMLSYKGGTLTLKWEGGADEKMTAEETAAIESGYDQRGVKWKDLHTLNSDAEGRLQYECMLKWKVPAETIVRKTLGKRVDWSGKKIDWSGR